MKKTLLTSSSMLVVLAGPALADLSLSGEAKVGIVGGDAYANDDAQFFNDLTLTFEGAGETDGGLTFGMVAEMVKANGPDTVNGPWDMDSEEVFISGGFGTLSMGAVDGAYYTRVGEVNLGVGTLADDETIHAGYNANGGLDEAYDGQVLRYDYEFGDFGLSLSLEQDDTGVGDDIWGAGFSYGMELANGVSLGFGLGYQTDSDDEIVGASFIGDFGNGFALALSVADFDGLVAADYTHTGIGVAYSAGPLSLAANYGVYDFAGAPDADGYGLSAAYDLGGGASVNVGYGSGEGTESYSLGMIMSF